MSGSKSTSTTKATTTQNTAQQSSEGIVGGSVYQAETINQEFSSEISEAFQALIGLSNQSIDAAVAAGGAAIEQVSRREEQVSNPELATLTKMAPVIMLGIAAISLVLIFRKKA